MRVLSKAKEGEAELMKNESIVAAFSPKASVTLYPGDCMKFLPQLPDASAQLILSSPPYNVGKPYEKKLSLETYLADQAEVIAECVRVLHPRGSICWEVGNYIDKGEVFPLDILLYPKFKEHGLKLRNRIVWHFGHGLHCAKRFSGRHETILWFTKGDDYVFNLDPIRIPTKYPGKKYFKGPRKGEYSANPLGKNPSDVWDIPNVKYNHVEKTIHPCQFPVELVERFVLSMTNEGDLVLDPFMGVGSTAVGAILHKRRAAGAELMPKYIEIAKERVGLALMGKIRTRPMDRPVYVPPVNSSLLHRDDAQRAGLTIEKGL